MGLTLAAGGVRRAGFSERANRRLAGRGGFGNARFGFGRALSTWLRSTIGAETLSSTTGAEAVLSTGAGGAGGVLRVRAGPGRVSGSRRVGGLPRSPGGGGSGVGG
jgi:hypothetical protein